MLARIVPLLPEQPPNFKHERYNKWNGTCKDLSRQDSLWRLT